MSDARRAPGLSKPGQWLARATMPPAKLTGWGWTWRLVVRCVATLAMTALGAFWLGDAVRSGHPDWFELTGCIAGWLYSVILTAAVIVAFRRRPRKAAGLGH